VTVQLTSLEAYDVLQPELSKRQKEVYETIKKHQAVSINDICRMQGVDGKNVTGRLKELREKGLIYKVGFKFDRLTGRRNLLWSIIG